MPATNRPKILVMKIKEFSEAFVSIDDISDFYSVSNVNHNGCYCWSNSLTSIDGILSFKEANSTVSNVGLKSLTEDYIADYRLLNAGWAFADAILISGQNVRSEPLLELSIEFDDLIDYRQRVLGKSFQPAVVIISPSGDLCWDRPLFHLPGRQILVYSSGQGYDRVKLSLRDAQPSGNSWSAITILNLDQMEGERPLVKLMNNLTQKGIKFVDVSAGGKIISSLIELQLLSEIRYTMAGHIIGPLNSTYEQRPSLFPADRKSFLPEKTPLVIWKGIRCLGDHFIFLRGVLDYTKV
jgi:riboflavin biosynthesis pyrimidine reductase